MDKFCWLARVASKIACAMKSSTAVQKGKRAESPMFLAFVGVLISILGCESGPSFGWWKKDFEPETFARDTTYCSDFAKSVVSGIKAQHLRDARRKTEFRRKLIVRCLESKGYRWVELRRGKPVSIPTDRKRDIAL